MSKNDVHVIEVSTVVALGIEFGFSKRVQPEI
jgi:hypothetical protein